jgi:hypothetical protein
MLTCVPSCTHHAHSYFMFMPGIRKRDGLEVMVTEHGVSRGWGKGEISGMMNNFKSVSAIFAPTVFAKAYEMGTTGGTPDTDYPGAPMMMGAVTTIASQLLYMAMLSSSDEDEGVVP